MVKNSELEQARPKSYQQEVLPTHDEVITRAQEALQRQPMVETVEKSAIMQKLYSTPEVIGTAEASVKLQTAKIDIVEHPAIIPERTQPATISEQTAQKPEIQKKVLLGDIATVPVAPVTKPLERTETITPDLKEAVVENQLPTEAFELLPRPEADSILDELPILLEDTAEKPASLQEADYVMDAEAFRENHTDLEAVLISFQNEDSEFIIEPAINTEDQAIIPEALVPEAAEPKPLPDSIINFFTEQLAMHEPEESQMALETLSEITTIAFQIRETDLGDDELGEMTEKLEEICRQLLEELNITFNESDLEKLIAGLIEPAPQPKSIAKTSESKPLYDALHEIKGDNGLGQMLLVDTAQVLKNFVPNHNLIGSLALMLVQQQPSGITY